MHEKIKQDIYTAMRAKDSLRLTTLRGVVAAFTNELVAKGKKPNEVIDDKDAEAVIKRLVKQRKDSIEQFEKGGRNDLAKNEKAELKILEKFLPEQMEEDKIKEIVLKKKEELGVSDKTKMGILIGAVMKECAGSADGSVVKKIVEEILS